MYNIYKITSNPVVDFGKRELAMERYYDHMMMVHTMNSIFKTKSAAEYAQ